MSYQSSRVAANGGDANEKEIPKEEQPFIDVWEKSEPSRVFFFLPIFIVASPLAISFLGLEVPPIWWVVVLLVAVYMILSVLKRDKPPFDEYGWLSLDNTTTSQSRIVNDFVEGLIETGIIDGKTKYGNVKYGIDRDGSDEDTLAIWLDIKQAGKTPDRIKDALINIAPGLGAFAATYERVSNTKHLVRYEFVDQIDRMTEDYRYEDFIDDDNEYRGDE